MTETILVTGSCGFTGSNMLEYLAEESPTAEIIATDLPGSDRGEYYVESPGSEDPQPVYYEEILDEMDVEFIPADLTEPDDVEELVAAHDYDTVYNIASLYDYFAPREVLYEVNVDGARNLMSELAKQDSCRVIHWSTLGVLGDAGFDRPKDEEDGYHPDNRYCESKVAQEQIVKTFEDRLDISIIRPAPIYGPRHRYGVYNVLAFIEAVGFVPMWQNYPRKYQRHFPCVHVDDVIRAADHLASKPETIGETYNVLSDPIKSDEMLEFFGEQLSRRAVPLPTPEPLYRLLASITYSITLRVEKRARANDERPLVEAPTVRYVTGNMWFSNQKIKDTGFEFRYEDPRDGLEEYIEWCRSHGYLKPPTERTSRVDSVKRSLQSRLSWS
jgi:nucleoside-diphosphate-sugar epimerase